jgi:uncharacterized protein
MEKEDTIEFEWDEDKEKNNIRKHGVSFTEAAETFFDPRGLQLFDESHSQNEIRYYWIGKSTESRILTTRFVYRNKKIRIFGSAEWRKFRRIYETA